MKWTFSPILASLFSDITEAQILEIFYFLTAISLGISVPTLMNYFAFGHFARSLFWEQFSQQLNSNSRNMRIKCTVLSKDARETSINSLSWNNMKLIIVIFYSNCLDLPVRVLLDRYYNSELPCYIFSYSLPHKQHVF